MKKTYNIIKKIILTDTGGFTLIELAVAMVITIIVLAAAGSIYLSSNNMLASYTKQGIVRDSAEHIETVISQQLSYATTLEITNSQVASVKSNHVIRISKDGNIYLDGSDIVYDEYVKKLNQIVFIRRPEDNTTEDALDRDRSVLGMVLITEDEDGDVEFRREITLKLINIAAKPGRHIKYDADADTTEDISDGAGGAVATDFITSRDEDIYIYYNLE